MSKKNYAIVFLKGIACIYVIFIHHTFPLPFNHFVLSIGRAAVPLNIPLQMSTLFGNSEHPFPEKQCMPFR